jgi:hypothetical protein
VDQETALHVSEALSGLTAMIFAGAPIDGSEGFRNVHKNVAGDTISMTNHAILPTISASAAMAVNQLTIQIELGRSRKSAPWYIESPCSYWEMQREEVIQS